MKHLFDYKYEFLILDFIYGLYCGDFRIQDVVSEIYCNYPHSIAHVLCKPIIDYIYESAL